MRRTLTEALRRQITAAAPAPMEEAEAPVWKPGLGEEAEVPAPVRPPREDPAEDAPAQRARPDAEGSVRRAGARAPEPDPQGLLPYERRKRPWTLYR